MTLASLFVAALMPLSVLASPVFVFVRHREQRVARWEWFDAEWGGEFSTSECISECITVEEM